jgi:hypothetical protein
VLVGHTVSNWLDNGRRLRPSVAADTTHTTFSATSSDASYEQKASTADAAITLSHTNEPACVSHSVGTTEPTSASSSPPAATETHLPSLEGLEGIERLDATQRGLVYLKYLVRHGVYNEGFQVQDLPPQYHRSAGLDESSDERN